MDRTESAIQAAKEGDDQTARGLLKEVLEEDADNERAWLWLSQVVESDAERGLCLQQVLRINPENVGARRGLAHLGFPLAAKEVTGEPLQPPLEPAVTLRAVREAGRPREVIAKPVPELPKAPARMPPIKAATPPKRRRRSLTPILVGLAGGLAVILIVFVVTTWLGDGEPETGVVVEPTVPIQIVEEATVEVPTELPTQLPPPTELPTQLPPPTELPTQPPQPTERADTPTPPPTEPAPTRTPPKPTESPATPIPTARPEAQAVLTRGKTDSGGIVEVELHDGATTEVQVGSSTGQPVTGGDVVAVSDPSGLTLIAVAPGHRPYLGTWAMETVSTESRASAASDPEERLSIQLSAETDAYMAETNVNKDHLLNLPDYAPEWESIREPSGDICRVLEGSGHNYRTVLGLTDDPSGPHFEMGVASTADAGELCLHAVPPSDVRGDLRVVRSDDFDTTIVAWLPNEEETFGILYGRVVGEDGEGVAGATVLVEESDLSVTTLPDGWYGLAVPDSAMWSISAELDDLGAGPVQVDVLAGEITDAPPMQMATVATVVTEGPSPEEIVLTYWGHVNNGRYDAAWKLLSPRFQEDRFGLDAQGYYQHYAKMGLCQVLAEDVRLLEEDAATAVVAAHMLYETGTGCELEAFEFDFHLVYDEDQAAWLLDDSVWRGVSRRPSG